MILYILDINKRIKKTIIIYFLITIFLIIFDRVYSLFSHGVSSLSMNLMFLYPLLGGVVVYYILGYLSKNKKNSMIISFNIYNSGIAILTVGSLLKGIMDIAGTSSEYIKYYLIIGIFFVCTSIIMFIKSIYNQYSWM